MSTQILHFLDGERHKFVDIPIIDDDIPEGAERFQLILSEPSSGLELGTNTTGRHKCRVENSNGTEDPIQLNAKYKMSNV